MAAVKLTEAMIKAVARPHKRFVLVWDSVVTGLALCVTANDVRSFVFNYRTKTGIERRMTLGRVSSTSLAAARDRARSLDGKVAGGRDPLEEERKERAAREAERVKAITFGTVADDYFKDSETLKKRHKTLHEQKRLLTAHALPALGRLPVAAITSEHISKLHADLESTPYQANRLLALLSIIFNFAIRKSHRADNPCRSIKRYAEDPREHTLDNEQFARVLATLDRHPNQVAAQAVKLIAATGSRKTEVLAATWNEFDLRRGTWTRLSHRTKGKHYEVIPLNSVALSILQKLGRRSEYLFPGEDGHIKDVKHVWEDVRREVGIRECRVHDMRHRYASVLVQQGESLFTVAKLLGHRPGSPVTARYAHHSDQSLRNASEKVAAAFTAAAATKK